MRDNARPESVHEAIGCIWTPFAPACLGRSRTQDIPACEAHYPGADGQKNSEISESFVGKLSAKPRKIPTRSSRDDRNVNSWLQLPGCVGVRCPDLNRDLSRCTIRLPYRMAGCRSARQPWRNRLVRLRPHRGLTVLLDAAKLRGTLTGQQFFPSPGARGTFLQHLFGVRVRSLG